MLHKQVKRWFHVTVAVLFKLFDNHIGKIDWKWSSTNPLAYFCSYVRQVLMQEYCDVTQGTRNTFIKSTTTNKSLISCINNFPKNYTIFEKYSRTSYAIVLWFKSLIHNNLKSVKVQFFFVFLPQTNIIEPKKVRVIKR